MPQKKLVKLKNKKTGEVIYMRKSGKPGSSQMPKLKLKKYSKVSRKREVFEESYVSGLKQSGNVRSNK